MGQDETTNDASSTLTLPAGSDLLKAKLHMSVNRLMRTYLYEFEAYVSAHDEAMRKLHDALPAEYKSYVNLADYLSDDGIEATRKKVLRVGNDCVRDMADLIDFLERKGS